MSDILQTTGTHRKPFTVAKDLSFTMSNDLQDSLALDQRPRLKEACIKLNEMAQQLEPDAKLPTMLELSGRFGMSVKTLNTAIRELERRQVLYSINGVGIYVASTKKRPQTGNLGFMTNNLRYIENLTYFGMIMAGMRTEAERRDRNMLFIDNVERFRRWEKIDGVLLTDAHEKSYASPVVPRPPKGLPAIALLNPMPGLTSVAADDFQGTYDLTQYLIGLGHRRIAYIAAFNEEVQLIHNRLQGYTTALRDAGIEREECWTRELYLGDLHLKGAGFEEIGERHIERWLAKGWDKANCTALIAQNDATALGMINALQAAGYRVPEDITVVGFDGVAHPSSQTRITTVEIPLFDLGQSAVKALCDWIDDPTQTPKDIALPGRLVIGETSAPPPKAAPQKRLRSG